MPPRCGASRAVSQASRLPGTASTRTIRARTVHSGVMATTEFGHTVRRWRDRVSPEAAGLPVGGHRRAAGLRREELALLAGISVDYVTRLEQGRATNPSEQVVEALGRALRLSGAEREHLFHAAGLRAAGAGHGARVHHAERPADAGPADRDARRGLRRGMDAAAGQPAVHGADGRVSRQRAQRGVAQLPRLGQPRPPHPGGPARARGRAGRRAARDGEPISGRPAAAAAGRGAAREQRPVRRAVGLRSRRPARRRRARPSTTRRWAP